jgi:Mn2+/Fe2+ NRAMP family transporter
VSFSRGIATYSQVGAQFGYGLSWTLICGFPLLASALYWAAVVNGVLAAPLMMVMMLIVDNHKAMGRRILSVPMTIMGWIATAVMAGASLILFLT